MGSSLRDEHAGCRRVVVGVRLGAGAKFESRVQKILEILVYRILGTGGEIDVDALRPATRAAYQTPAAEIVRGLAYATQRASAASSCTPARPNLI